MKRLENGKYKFEINEFKTGSFAVYCLNNSEKEEFIKYLYDCNVKKEEFRVEMGLFGILIKYIRTKADFLESPFRTPVNTISYEKLEFKQIKNTQFITHEELSERGIHTGDILFEKDGFIGIVFNEYVIYFNKNGVWGDIPEFEHIEFIIKKEDINHNRASNKLHPSVLSKALFTNNYDSVGLLDEFKTKLIKKEEDILEVTIYKVEFTPNGKLYDFLAEENTYNKEHLVVGAMVECNTKNGNRKYARIKEMEKRIITKQEYSSEYKFCRPVK